MHIRLDRQCAEYRRADASRDAVAHQHDPHRPRRGRSPRDDRVHTLRDPHVPLPTFPQRHLHLRLEHLRAVPLELHSGVSHDLYLPHGHPGGLEVHRGGAPAEKSRVVQQQAHFSHDRLRLRVLPDTLHTALHQHRGEAASGNVGRAGDSRESNETPADGQQHGRVSRTRDQHHPVLREAHRVPDEQRSQGHQRLDLQCSDQADTVRGADRVEHQAGQGVDGGETEAKEAHYETHRYQDGQRQGERLRET